MAQVLVRDIDSEVVDQLKENAKRNGRSLEAELRSILQRAAGIVTPEVRSKVESIRARLAGRTFSDSAELIREDRDR